MGRAGLALSGWRWGGGGGVAGAPGSTLGRTASVCAEGGPEGSAPDDGGLEPGGLTLGLRLGLRSGGGGGDERSAPGPIPRDEGGSGMRDVGGSPLVTGRGTTLTGRGTTLAGAGGGTEGTTGGTTGAAAGGSGWRSQAAGSSVGLAVLESFSSPIGLAARALASRQANLTRSSLCQQFRAARREMPRFPAGRDRLNNSSSPPRSALHIRARRLVRGRWPSLRINRGEAPLTSEGTRTMLGFFIGTACLVGLIAVARRGRRRYYGFHHGHHRHGGRFFLHRVLDRLDTTPGQEKVIRDALHDLGEEAWTLRREVKGTRSEIAAALRAPELDRSALDRVFAKHDELIEKLRSSALTAADQVHGTLDERQRQKLADMIEQGPWGYAAC